MKIDLRNQQSPIDINDAIKHVNLDALDDENRFKPAN